MLTPHLWLKTKKIADQTPRKVYFSVSKTVAKKATDRNLLKRRSKAIVRKHITEFKKGYIYFFSFNNSHTSFRSQKKAPRAQFKLNPRNRTYYVVTFNIVFIVPYYIFIEIPTPAGRLRWERLSMVELVGLRISTTLL